MSFKSYQDLQVWKRGMDIAVDLFKLTKSFPSDEQKVKAILSEITILSKQIRALLSSLGAKKNDQNQHLAISPPRHLVIRNIYEI